MLDDSILQTFIIDCSELLRDTENSLLQLESGKWHIEDCKICILPPHGKTEVYVRLINDLPESPSKLGEILFNGGALTQSELEEALQITAFALLIFTSLAPVAVLFMTYPDSHTSLSLKGKSET